MTTPLKDQPAFARTIFSNPTSKHFSGAPDFEMGSVGLTKLELFSAMAMQGILSAVSRVEKDDAGRIKYLGTFGETFLATVAICHAKALLDDLEKEKA